MHVRNGHGWYLTNYLEGYKIIIHNTNTNTIQSQYNLQPISPNLHTITYRSTPSYSRCNQSEPYLISKYLWEVSDSRCADSREIDDKEIDGSADDRHTVVQGVPRYVFLIHGISTGLPAIATCMVASMTRVRSIHISCLILWLIIFGGSGCNLINTITSSMLPIGINWIHFVSDLSGLGIGWFYTWN